MKSNEVFTRVSRKFREILRDFFLFRLGGRWRRRRTSPRPPPDRVLIHIGCGVFDDKRYINVDTRPGWHIDHVESIENCPRLFPPGYADLIYACHVLEHVPYREVPRTLEGLYGCLKKGGVLRLSVPDFRVIVRIYEEKHSIPDILSLLLGGQDYAGNVHRSVFDEGHLTAALRRAGFSDVRRWDPETATFHDFEDWSRRRKHLYGREWEISLNLEAVK